MKKRYLVLVLVLIFFVLIALSPFLISSPSALNFFVSAVNKKIPGRLSIDSWLIGWQQGILCQNVVYQNPEEGVNISVPSLTSNRGLMKLVLAPKNLGTVHVDSPLIELSGAAVQSYIARGKGGETDTKGPKTVVPDGTPPLWDQVSIELKSRGGQLKIDWREQDIDIVFKNMTIDTNLTAGVAEFDLGFQTMDQGFIEASGSLNLPAHEYDWLETITVEAEVMLSSLQLGEFLRAGAVLTDLPQGNGVLNADFQLKTIGIQSVELNGLAEFTGVTLSGGILGEDQPSFQKVHVNIDGGKWTDRGLSMNEFELVSDSIDMKVSGKFLPDNPKLNVSGAVSLPVLFDQFPRLLKVNESTFVETGIFDFSVDVNTMNSLQSLKLKAKLNNVGGIFQGRRFSWDSPVMLFFNGEKDEHKLQIHALQLDAPFARAKGSGDLHSFSMDGELDLKRVLADFGTLFQLDLSGSGSMEVAVKSNNVENDEDLVKVDVDINMNDFMLWRHEDQIIPFHQFSLIGGLKASDTLFTQKTGELDVQFALSSWFGEFFMVVNGEKSADRAFKGYYTTDSEVDLTQMASLLRMCNILNSKTRMSGAMQLQASGFVGGAPTEIKDFAAEITNFSLEGNDAVFSEPRLSIKVLQPVNEEVSFVSVRDLKVADNKDAFFRNGAGLNLVDFSARNISLHNVVLKAGSGEATINRLVIPDWQKPYENARYQLSLSADLEKITGGFQAIGLLPQDMDFSGSSKVRFHWAGEQMSNQEVYLQVQLADFTLKRKNNIYFESDDVVFTSRIRGQVPYGEMIVDGLKMGSSVLDLEATGNVILDGDIQLLELSGNMTPSLERFGSIIGHEFDVDLKMKGQPEEQFVLRYPLWSKPAQKINKLGIFSSLHATEFVLEGIELSDVSLPFHFDNSTLHMELSSLVNKGRMEFISDMDFIDDPPVIKTIGNSQVMSGVELDDALVTLMLSRFHPLFGGLTNPSGSIDVRLNSFWWPVGEGRENEANFTAVFDVREIKLQNREILNNILAVFALDKETIRLGDKEIKCAAKNGGVKCSPVRLLAGDSEVIISGTVSMDRLLDYTVEVPITRKLVSEEGYQILEGMRVKVAVHGPTVKPSFDRKTVVAAVQGLMKQAADEIVKKKKTE